MALYTNKTATSGGGSFTPGAANRIPFGNAGGTGLTDEAALTYDPSTNTLLLLSGALIVDGKIGSGASPGVNDQLLVSTGSELKLRNTQTTNSLYALFQNENPTLDFSIYSFGSAYGASPFFGETGATSTVLRNSAGKVILGTADAASVKFGTTNLIRGEFLSGGTFQLYPKAAGRACKVGGVIKTVITDTGNITTGEDDLHSYALDAAYLANDGESIEFEMAFTFAANANNKRIRVYFGATAIVDTTAVAQNAGQSVIRGRVVRTGATTQRAACFILGGTTIVDEAFYTTPGETLSGAITLKATGEATATDDIVQKLTVVKFHNANA